MQPKLHRLPDVLSEHINGMFAWQPIPASVSGFAAGVRLTEAALRGRLWRAHVASPDLLCSAARVARAYDDLAAIDRSMEEIALFHGFGTPRSLQRAVMALIGDTPRRSAKLLSAEAFANKLSSALHKV